jgi:alpha-mannosidase
MIKVHVVFNAHLDPIWLWSWRDGLDEVLNTSYYICNLLDRHPDIVFTRGEAWVYEQIKRIDPALFERIKEHIKAGRWSTVGGWYIQPDCNAPSGFALERQISLGQKLFREYFGTVPETGYNVDSFGHAATFPGYLRHAGQSSYVMMRPMEHEMHIPARLFRWRGYEGGPEVTTFRIAEAYCTPAGLTEKHIRAATTGLPEGISHTMCFIGIGDHGGGPTENMIEWCRANGKALPGIELIFSSPAKFFKDIAPDRDKLPLVTGELQMHAVGCYTVHRRVKTSLRKAEHKMIQAEVTLQKFQPDAGAFADEMEIAWKQVCFNQFHDTLGGTCLPSAYDDVDAQLGRALAIADEACSISLRKHLVTLPSDSAQRITFFNASDRGFSDFVEIEPWLEWSAWQPCWQLYNERDESVPYQVLDSESQALTRLLVPLSIGAGELKILRIVSGQTPAVESPTDLSVSPAALGVTSGSSIRLGTEGELKLPFLEAMPLPKLVLYDDPTDTWSHGIDRYAHKNPQTAIWQPARVMDKGPLMVSVIEVGTIGSSRVQAEWRIYKGFPMVECLLRVLWSEQRRVLKFEIDLPMDVAERHDGILGGSIVRPSDGRELPLRDWVRLCFTKKAEMAIVAPEVYALDGTPRRIGLTLLRSPLMAWHEPNPGINVRGIHSDRGEHFFRFRFLSGETLSNASLDQMSFGWQRPPLTADFTRGMKKRALRKEYEPPVIS